MKKLTLAVDFDLTLVDTLTPWFEWAVPQTDDPAEARKFFNTRGWSGCDWVPLMKASGVKEPFEYWLQHDLCENLKPMAWSVRSLVAIREAARKRGYDLNIICVSKCVPEHIASKKRFLERECGGIFDAFIDASEKQYIDFDLIIDDSFEVVKSCAEAGKKVVVPTTSTSDVTSVFDGTNHPNVYQWGETYGDFWYTIMNHIGVDVLVGIMEK
ncbi:HAD-like domain protein [Vibrio phage 1.244.A._10N.261.54.C3]|nr:HAD-like domain protein [Vibrio phage 1.244.A._10N.261.54.C3]AUR98814.1 HAD-like domain protein [Vibrio phage 1.255.O._10N.286.45.F1]